MNFSGKIVDRISIDRSLIKTAIVVYEDDIFKAKTVNGLFPIHDWDNLNCNVVYSLPKNDAHDPWHAKSHKVTVSHPHIVKKFWAKYKPGLKIHGEVKNGIFYERDISRNTKK